jgi:excisionase family DNA binding protein
MKAKEPIRKICEYCGCEFKAYTQNARYCSHDCNRKAYREIKRKEVISLTASIASKTKKEQTKADLSEREYLSISEAAAIMGVSRWTIYRNVANSVIPAKRLSQRITLIRRKDIESLFDAAEAYEVLKTGERKPVDEWYTIEEITEKYGLLRHRIRKIINRESIPTKKAGTRTLIAKNKIDAYFRKKGFDNSLFNLADWITTPEIMDMYEMTEQTVRGFVSRYAIPKKRLNGKLYYSKQHVDKLKYEE